MDDPTARRANAEAVEAYYARDLERDRLAAGVGAIEFARTVEIIERTLPPPPAVVADIGGGPGRYTDWLVDAGYDVIHRDVIAHHVDQVRRRHGDRVDSRVGDGCALDLVDESVNAVLLLGPLYHLPDADDRMQALAETKRVLRPGGAVYAAAICRWASRINGMIAQRVHVEFPVVLDLIDEVEESGFMAPVAVGGFTARTHRPGELRDEIVAAGFELDAVVSVESIAGVFTDDEADRWMHDPDQRPVLLNSLRALEAVPELMGAGSHLLAVARKTGTGAPAGAPVPF